EELFISFGFDAHCVSIRRQNHDLQTLPSTRTSRIRASALTAVVKIQCGPRTISGCFILANVPMITRNKTNRVFLVCRGLEWLVLFLNDVVINFCVGKLS